MQIFIYIVIFVLGLVLGSFYNVIGYRLPKKESIVFPSSHCPNCNHKLAFLDLVPVFSYLFLSGKCRYCKKKISIIYPIIEFLTGALFVLSYYLYGFSFEFGIALTISSVAMITFASDIRYLVIEDAVLIVGGVLILIFAFLESSTRGLHVILDGIISFIIVFAIKYLADIIFKKEAMGGGDVKLLTFIGAIVSYPMAIMTLCLSAFIAFPYAVFVYFKKEEHILPLGPFLCIAGLIIFFLGIDFNYLMEIMAN